MKNSPSKSGPDKLARRKQPRQARARVTVDSILQAAREIIEKRGFSDITTTVIAEKAGVSIGSFYEYFPSKEAVLIALYEQASLDAVNRVRDLIDEILDLPIEDAIPRAVELLYAIHADNQLILLNMLSELPALKQTIHPITYDRLAKGTVRTYLEHIGFRLEAEEMERCLFFTNHMVMGSIKSYLSNPPIYMSPEAFIADLSAILISYLKDIESGRTRIV